MEYLTSWGWGFERKADSENQHGTKCEYCGFRSGVAEDSMLLEYDTEEIRNWVPTVRGRVVAWALNVIFLAYFYC
jgi:hypothetical protein